MQTRDGKNAILYLVRTIVAPPLDVYRAWTDPRELRRWWGPEEGYTAEVDLLDARSGGQFRIGMRPPGETPYFVGGSFRQVRAPNLLVFTWEWEDLHTWSAEPLEELPPASVVTVMFRERLEGKQTEVFMTHEGLVDERVFEDHRWGWSGTLDRLARLI